MRTYILSEFFKCTLSKICVHTQCLDFMFEFATKCNEQFFQISFYITYLLKIKTT